MGVFRIQRMALSTGGVPETGQLRVFGGEGKAKADGIDKTARLSDGGNPGLWGPVIGEIA